MIKIIKQRISFCSLTSMNKFMFSNVSDDEKVLTILKGVWSEHIFTQICNIYQRTPKILIDQLRDYKLSEPIMNKLLQGSSNFSSFSEQQIKYAGDEIKSAFDPFKGVILPIQLRTVQSRFANAINLKSQRISFYPNTLVTPFIFNSINGTILRQSQQPRQITVGKPGISKSMSYLLSWYLTSENAKFRMLYPQMALKFSNDQVISEKGKKIFYMNFSTQITFSNFVKLILAQCNQIKNFLAQQKVKQYLKINNYDLLSQFLQEIKTIYNRNNIYTLVVVDQINALARILNAYNIQYQNNKNLKNNQQNLKIQQNARIYLQIFKALYNFTPLIFNSSTNIQKHLLGSYGSNKFDLKMDEHADPQFYQCNYAHTDVSAKQIYRYFWYQFVKIAKAKSFDEQKLRKIQKEFLEICDNFASIYGLSTFITPLSIFKVMSRNLTKQRIQQCFSDTENIKKLIYQYLQIQLKKGQILQLKAKKFLFDQNPKNRFIKCSIALNSLEYLKKHPNAQKIPISQLKVDPSSLLELYDKDLFTFKTKQEEKYLKLNIMPSQFFIIANLWYDLIIKHPLFLKLTIQMNLKNDLYGDLLESLIIHKISLCKISELQINQNLSFKFQNPMPYPHCTPQNINYFLHIQLLFEKAKQSKSENYCFGYPTIRDQSSPNNPSIDFLGVRYKQVCIQTKDENQNSKLKILQEFQVISFDLTIGQQTKKKINNAVKQIDKYKNTNIKFSKRYATQTYPLQFINQADKYLNKNQKNNFKNVVENQLKIAHTRNDQNLIPIYQEILIFLQAELKQKQELKSHPLYRFENIKKHSLQQIIKKYIQKISQIFKDKKILINYNEEYKKSIVSWTHYIVCPQNLIKKTEQAEIELIPINHIKVHCLKSKSDNDIGEFQSYRNFEAEILQKVFKKKVKIVLT